MNFTRCERERDGVLTDKDRLYGGVESAVIRGHELRGAWFVYSRDEYWNINKYDTIMYDIYDYITYYDIYIILHITYIYIILHITTYYTIMRHCV